MRGAVLAGLSAAKSIMVLRRRRSSRPTSLRRLRTLPPLFCETSTSSRKTRPRKFEIVFKHAVDNESERRDRAAARDTPRRCPKAHLIDERSDKLTPSADSCSQGEWCFATVSQTNNPPSQRVDGACEHSVQHRDDVDRNCHVVPPSATSMTTPLGSQRWQMSSAGQSKP
jgi:hypothetical protein